MHYYYLRAEGSRPPSPLPRNETWAQGALLGPGPGIGPIGARQIQKKTRLLRFPRTSKNKFSGLAGLATKILARSRRIFLTY